MDPHGETVLIVGAGPTGLVAAFTLLINGVRPRIIDKGAGERYGSKALVITPRSQELYQSLGVLSDIMAAARPAPDVRVYQPGTLNLMSEQNLFEANPQVTPDCPFPQGLSLAQGHLEGILRAHLKHRFDLEPEFGTSLLSFEEYTEHLTAHLEYGVIGSEQPTRQDVQVSYIIGADGGKSGVRKSLGLPFEGVTLPGLMLYGDVHVEGINQNTWHVWGDTSSLLVAFWPIGANSDEAMAFRCFGAQLSDERAAELTQDTDALARLVTDHVGLPEVKLGKWASLTSFRTNVRMVPSFSSPGLRSFLAGDAAHTHSPAGGQGLNSSVQDAANLGWKLALVLHGHADRTLLASYSAERVPVIRAMLIQTTAELKRTGTWAAKQDVQSTPPDFTQLGVKYAGSSLVFDQLGEQISPPNPSEVIERRPSPAVRGDQLRAGNRAPDAPRLLVLSGEEEGLEITLFDIFDLTAHTIIIFSAPEASVTAIAETLSTLQLARSMGLVRIVVLLSSRSGAEETLKNDVDRVLLDSASHAFSAYAPARLGSLAVFIIRPDQIIGAITSNAEGSRRYLCSIFTLSSP